ncbi:MAG: succinate dehydrogenase assembly factor 2 [Alphaproteobacteria bacterium]|nr:succinate dehydrogenase assembly factor 2 [Alphaproteobacteria bacterium]
MDIDARRKRILYRATHRGTKEADVMIGGFFSAVFAELDPAEFDQIEQLLDEPDPDLVNWLLGRAVVPDRWRGTIYDRLERHVRDTAAL